MKIALLHFALLDGPQTQNIEKLCRGIKIAAKLGAKWVIAPEMAVQGYRMYCTGAPFSLYKITSEVTDKNYKELLKSLTTEASSKRLQAVRAKYGITDDDGVNTESLLKLTEANRKQLVSSNILEPFFKLAQNNKISLILGCGAVDNQGPHNSSLVINQEGTVSCYHNKIKVVKWITEEWAVAGEALKVNSIDEIQVGLLVCADTWFEEHGEAYKNLGAELMITVAAWPDGGCGGPPLEAWKRTSRAAKGLPLIVCNQTGSFVMDCTKAQSALVEGGEVVCSYAGAEAVLLCDFDKVTKTFPQQTFEVIPLGK